MKGPQNLVSCARKRKINSFLDQSLIGLDMKESSWKKGKNDNSN